MKSLIRLHVSLCCIKYQGSQFKHYKRIIIYKYIYFLPNTSSQPKMSGLYFKGKKMFFPLKTSFGKKKKFSKDFSYVRSKFQPLIYLNVTFRKNIKRLGRSKPDMQMYIHLHYCFTDFHFITINIKISRYDKYSPKINLLMLKVNFSHQYILCHIS